jgi:hypothetical protein
MLNPVPDCHFIYEDVKTFRVQKRFDSGTGIWYIARKRPDSHQAVFTQVSVLQWVSSDLPGEKVDPDGIRTRVAALKGLCPGPLDDGANS